MTNQEAVTKVVQHLRTQQVRSVKDGRCLYRGPDGLKCAIGVLIPDDQFDRAMEGLPIEDLVKFKIPALESLDHALLARIQGIYDCAIIETWEFRFQQVAKTHGLVVPPNV